MGKILGKIPVIWCAQDVWQSLLAPQDWEVLLLVVAEES